MKSGQSQKSSPQDVTLQQTSEVRVGVEGMLGWNLPRRRNHKCEAPVACQNMAHSDNWKRPMWLEQFATEGVGQKVRDMSSGLYSKSKGTPQQGFKLRRYGGSDMATIWLS